MGTYLMKSETKLLARNMYSAIMTTAVGLDTVTKEQRAELFKEAAKVCFEAASAFEAVEADF
jgi:hypothetical protein